MTDKTAGQFLSLALQIIHATGGDTARADEAAHVIAVAFRSPPSALEAKGPAEYLHDEVRADGSISTEICDKTDPGAYPVYRALPAPKAAGDEITDDDPDVVLVARAIAENGLGRPWHDLLPVNAHDIDQGDLIEYAQAAVAAMRAKPSGDARAAVIEDKTR